MNTPKAKLLKRKSRFRYGLLKQTRKSGKVRLSVFRSNLHIYAQVIDDVKGCTLASASTVDKEVKEAISKTSTKEAASVVGKLVAQRAVKSGVKEVVFDRGGYIYHGRVKALADGAREGGLKF